ncbi:low molecular weight phosphatase family protein [Candidatus Bipolaricaulota bacterium]|nr:low molecular weight phosphatase family protein [Candidatus Bipolaricaulota bacterium]MBS3814354.1 low molecular weight phosphatase family protein [Candidatus Bipolaricaulota bacterium]MBS3825956.1 low molecular weight phosphatase family protein [Candidatus Bipolaricaulota bacterium]
MTNKRECVAFICVQNAGRSQMAAAFARKKIEEENLPVKVISGGTVPADSVHGVVVKAMAEKGYDLSDNQPRNVEPEELVNCNYVITMGCSAQGVCPATWEGTDREWDLDDPAEADKEKVKKIRDEIESRVDSLLEEITQD